MTKKIVLYNPEIPGNTGSIGRTCVALNYELILIRPYGFDLSEKAVRRAGLDYWKHVNLKEYDNFNDFLTTEEPSPNAMMFLSKTAKTNYFSADYTKVDYMIFGSETKGLPQELFQTYADHFYSLPMFTDKIRSLNLSNAATAVAYECLRQNS